MVMMNREGGQMKIQQMAFMIVAVFIFFTLVGLFFVSWQSRSIGRNAADLQKQQALSSIEVIRNMPELNCDLTEGLCVDEDKLNVLAAGLSDDYAEFWPVASVKVYKVYPSFETEGSKKCPGLNCNYWEVYDSGQTSSEEFSGYVNICKKMRERGSNYEKCEVGKLLVGVYET
tara:strand:- start:3976 stop:4494 length:519 start_codon:yes stop_codon:yes gene_type:complete